MLHLWQAVQGEGGGHNNKKTHGWIVVFRVQASEVCLRPCCVFDVSSPPAVPPQRKDKLREHMQRMHNPEREAKKADRVHRSKALKLKVPTTDFESFMFKCRVCMMGFRRRGMLVSRRPLQSTW